MESILCLIHVQEDGQIAKSGWEALGALSDVSGKLGGSSVSVGLIGSAVQAAAKQLGALAQAKMLTVEGADFKDARYGSDVLAAEAIAKASKATVIIAPATARCQKSVPGLAAKLSGRVDTRISALSVEGGKLTASRWFYRQRMMANMSRKERPWVLLVESGIAKPLEAKEGSPLTEAVSVDVPANCKRTEVVGIEAPPADQQTIRPDADMLFVAGAGWTKKQSDGQVHAKDAEKLILDFTHKGKASLGSSKSLVDQSSEGEAVLTCLSHLNQVGQTGSTPRHPKGLATCCHGEEPHVVGWRFINERRAVNLDANCGWAQGKADVLYVADAFKVMEKVNELLG